jgi:perosamine synthetase
MTQFIPLNPGLPARWLLGLPGSTRFSGSNDGFLHGERRIMTYSGSAALCAAARGLKRIGRRQLVAPSFNCGHEIEPFVREGFAVDAYRVDHEGRMDLSDLESRLRSNQQVVLATHFFGFPTDIKAVRELCDTKGAYLIEDCAHAFLSCSGDKYLGATGDLSIFSYWKSLPIPDGGCLIFNNRDIPAIPPPSRAPFVPVYKKAVKLLLEDLFSRADAKSKLGYNTLQLTKKAMIAGERIVSWSIGRRGAAFETPDVNSLEYDSSVLDFRISQRSLFIMSKIDTSSVKRRRRENYRYVHEALSDLKSLRPLFNALPDGTCPLRFPIVPPRDHPRVREIMRGYPLVYLWWPQFHPSVPWDRFPESRWLKKNCYVIEIHQNMETKHLDYLVDQVLRADRDLQHDLQ